MLAMRSEACAACLVRGATLEDVPALVEGNARLAAETEDKRLDPAVLAQGIRTLLENPHRGRYFVACRGAEVVGQLMITPEWSDWRNGEIWWLQSVYVWPEFRRQGVYRALHAAMVAAARQQGNVVALRLYVVPGNTAARRTYESQGLRDAGYIVYEQALERGSHGG
jgi:GNAT superfamily N-acetyltransferase